MRYRIGITDARVFDQATRRRLRGAEEAQRRRAPFARGNHSPADPARSVS